MINLILLLGFFISLVLSSTPGRADTVTDDVLEGTNDVQCTMITVVRPVLPAHQSLFSKDTISKFLPTDMTPTSNADLFVAQFGSGIAQRLSQNILAGQIFRTSSIGRATTKFESMLSTSPNTGSQFSFQVKVPERQAVLSLKGKVNSELVWVVDQNSFKWVLSRAVTKNTTIAFTNVASINTQSASSILSLSHSF